MSFTIQQQRNFIETHFLKNDIVNHIPDRVDTNVDPFIPSQPPTLYANTIKPENTNNSYKYLDDLMLSNDIVLFPRNLLDEYKIHICPFSVNTKLETPFLQFMFSKNNAQYTFPVFDLHMKSIHDSSVSKIMYSNDDDEDNSDSDQDGDHSVNNEFLDQCISYFHDNILKETDIDDDIDIKTRYRGFMEQDDTNTLYVFFDCTGLHVDVYNDKFKTNDYIFAIVDEINKRKINDVYIDNDIVTLFQKNPFITELNTRNGEPIILPIISYICSENDDEKYTNIYNFVNENETDDILLIPPQINHPIYHDTYVFSEKALSGIYTNIKRFALFYEDFIQETENMDIPSVENVEIVDNSEDMDVSSDENEEDNENMDESIDENEEDNENMDESSDENEEDNENMDESSDENEEDNDNMDESSDESIDESDSDMDVSSDEDNENMDLVLDENVVFTFKNANEQSFYGTYSIETFIEI
tara:strand:+ start:957 stop:2372 length:1416 start_codon:yes stop_codon:yes gene_type:complete